MNPKLSKKAIKEFEVVTNIKVIKLLLDGTRKDIVFKYLVNKPMTVKQLSVAMNKKPGTVLHHVQKLKSVGIIVLVETRETPRGIVERYYRAIAREFRLGISERMSAYDESTVPPKDRVNATLLGLSTLGVVITESEFKHARTILQKLIDRETEMSLVYNTPKNHAYQRLPQSTRRDVSQRMLQFLLSQDEVHQKILSEWNGIIAYYLKKTSSELA
ncbi:MAG: winged helix-turn-helix transcriptional regulator [Candidatus Thorarchaeota archaeon]|nr:winged helix-turn-helix transcriptional regulator [Candidatus Thorarchaeota archaeon]